MVLHQALRQGEQWRILPRAPAALVDPPRAPRTEMRVLDPTQVHTLLDAAHGKRLEALPVLALAAARAKGSCSACTGAP